MTFTAQPGGTAQSLTRQVTSSTGSVLTLNAPLASTTSGVQWLTATLSPMTTPSTLTVTANPALVQPGVHQGTIILSSTPASNIVSIPVVLNVTTTGAGFVNPGSLSFNYASGSSTPQTATLNVSGSATGQAFTATADQTWLTIFPQQGTTPGTISVLSNPTGRADGTYNANITVSFTGLTQSQTIPVTMTIAAAPTLVVNKDPVRFNYQIGGTAPASQRTSINVTSTGTALTYIATATTQTGFNWLFVTPASGSTPGALTIEVNAANLSPATYTGTVSITPAMAGATRQDIPVSLTVGTVPLLGFTLNNQPTSALTFTHQFGGVPPAAQTLASVSTSTALTFFVQAVYSQSQAMNWISVNPASSTTPTGFTVTVSPEGLTPGTYTANLLVTAPGARTCRLR
jgi:hypothetical protein